jgi:hypothetical protein
VRQCEQIDFQSSLLLVGATRSSPITELKPLRPSRPHASARPAELLFDLTVGGRSSWELVERFMEEILGLFATTLAAADKAEVGDHSSLVLLVSEFPKDDERLLEVLKRRRRAGMRKSKSEVIECQCLGSPVTEVTHNGERGTMLFGC